MPCECVPMRRQRVRTLTNDQLLEELTVLMVEALLDALPFESKEATRLATLLDEYRRRERRCMRRNNCCCEDCMEMLPHIGD